MLPAHVQIGRCLFVVENALAVVVIHFLRSVWGSVGAYLLLYRVA